MIQLLEAGCIVVLGCEGRSVDDKDMYESCEREESM